MPVIARTSFLVLLVLVFVAATALAGCASGASTVLSTVGRPIGDSSGGNAGATAAPSPAAGNVGGVGGDAAGGGPPEALIDQLKIVYTGSLQLVVTDLSAALASAKASILATGGYVGASQESNNADRSVASITYRIPAERWDDAIHDLRGLATKVVAEQTQATEVGGQIVDLEARLKNLRASEASLQAIAEGTGTVTDLLDVEAQLTNVRGQIEQLDGQRAQLEDQVAYGTLVTTFGLEVVQVQEAAQGWDPAEDVDGATATLIGAGQTLVSGSIWFGIVWLPLILVIVVLAVIGRWAFRRLAPRGGPSGPIAGWGDGS
jgi:hypothetical protein